MSLSSSSTDSYISSCRREASNPASRSESATRAASLRFRNCSGERFTATLMCGGHLAASLHSSPRVPKRNDQSRFLRYRNELDRRDQSFIWMSPAHERLAGRDLLSSEVYQRLIEQLPARPSRGRDEVRFSFLAWLAGERPCPGQIACRCRGRLLSPGKGQCRQP